VVLIDILIIGDYRVKHITEATDIDTEDPTHLLRYGTSAPAAGGDREPAFDRHGCCPSRRFEKWCRLGGAAQSGLHRKAAGLFFGPCTAGASAMRMELLMRDAGTPGSGADLLR
jgi:hypothetical protein